MLLGCGTRGRDTFTDAKSTRVQVPSATVSAPADAYVYVARRLHGTVGLIGTRVLSLEEGQRMVDRIANDLETCLMARQQRGGLTAGAVQLVAVGSARGTDVSDMRVSPGATADALECIVAPLRALPFPNAPTSDSVPALAIEASWGGPRL
jgi:hypothetical protein